MATTPSSCIDAPQVRDQCHPLPADPASAFPLALEPSERLPDRASARQPDVKPLVTSPPEALWQWAPGCQIQNPRTISERITPWNVGQLPAVLSSVLTRRGR